MKKMNVAVLFGGCSPEYGVSLESAHAVITHLDRARFNPVMIGISREGQWFLFKGDASQAPAGYLVQSRRLPEGHALSRPGRRRAMGL